MRKVLVLVVALLCLIEVCAAFWSHGPAFASLPRHAYETSHLLSHFKMVTTLRQIDRVRRWFALKPQRFQIRDCTCPGCYGSSILSALLAGGEGEKEGGSPGGSSEGKPADAKVGDGQSTEEGLDSVSSAMISALQGYKKFISPLLPPSCRFLPTCSAYSMQAIKEYGPEKGLVLTAWRLIRCNPFHWGGGGKGYDPPRWPMVPYNYHWP